MNTNPGDLRRYAGAAFLLLIIIAVWFSPLDQKATQSIDAGMKRAFVTFAAARGLNAAISMVQGTEVTVGVGLGATFSVGEVLDPVNDLVEQFSDLMLLATVSFGIQKMLLVIGEHNATKVVVMALILAWAAFYAFRGRPPGFLTSLLILGLMMRFSIPVATVATDAMFRVFLSEQYETSEQVVTATTATVAEFRPMADSGAGSPQGKVNPPSGTPTTDNSIADTVRGWFDKTPPSSVAPADQRKPAKAANASGAMASAKGDSAPVQDSGFTWKWPSFGLPEMPNPAAKLEALKLKAEQGAEHIVRLIVVFLFQTLIIPLAILWILYRLATNVLSPAVRVEVRSDYPRERDPGSREKSP